MTTGAGVHLRALDGRDAPALAAFRCRSMGDPSSELIEVMVRSGANIEAIPGDGDFCRCVIPLDGLDDDTDDEVAGGRSGLSGSP